MLTGLKNFFGGVKARSEDAVDDLGDRFGHGKWVFIGLFIYLILATGVGIYWSMAPQPFNVVDSAALMTNVTPEQKASSKPITGTVTTSALIRAAETLLDKPGGFLSNDIAPPGVWLDNMPNWEYGVLIQTRDLAKALRESFSRSQSQSLEDADLAKAEARFNFDTTSWALPATESEYRDGIKFTREYLTRLSSVDNPEAQFFARADNLNYWLRTVETRLGNLSQRLSASVGQRRLNTDLAGQTGGTQATPSPEDMIIKTPWHKIDDVFYEARGASWALIHFLKAVEEDFGHVLDKKNARVSLQQIIRELEETQGVIYSPMILNGSGFGLVANHSLVMASYISRANAALIDLRRLLELG